MMKLSNLFTACIFLFGISNSLFAAPAISSVSPSNGPISGGNNVTINGSGFLSATNVNFGIRPAASFTVNSDTSITAQVPTGTAGRVDVQVIVAAQPSPITPGD